MQKYKNVLVRDETKSQIDYLSKVTGKSKTQLFAEIFEECFSIVASLKPHSKKIGMRVDSSILSQSVSIEFLGKSRIIIGHFQSDESDKVVDAKIKEECEKVIENE